MGEWSDYFEDFPEENPANQREDISGDALRARVAREATYSPSVLAQIAEGRKKREAAEILLLGMRLKDRENAQAELHRSIGGLEKSVATLPAQIDERSAQIWELTRSIDVITEPFFPNWLASREGKKLSDVKR